MPTIPAHKTTREIVERFDTAEAAEKYSRSLPGTTTHRREARCIRKALGELPRGSKVIDLPCGTGRLLPLLNNMGFHITASDSSKHMVELARNYAEKVAINTNQVRFLVANVFETPFEDNEFDGVICNRLIHHFPASDDRRNALAELKRICKGPIVVSFFCNLAYDSVVFHFRNAISREKASDRIPIGYGVFARDVAASGLRIKKTCAARPGISKQWYALLEGRG